MKENGNGKTFALKQVVLGFVTKNLDDASTLSLILRNFDVDF